VSERTWLGALAALAAIRVAIPLAALAASGSALPGMPRYDYAPLNGDAHAYYHTARELLSSLASVHPAALVVLAAAVLSAIATAVVLWRRRPGLRWLALVLAAAAPALVALAAILELPRTGAPVVGWPLVWGAALAPFRALGPVDVDLGFAIGLAVSLLALAVTVVATAYAGLLATGRRSVGIVAAALFASWPLLLGLLGGEDAWENGTWHVAAGLHVYTEPLSTALVAVAVVLLLARPTPERLALAGVALGVATVVKLSNGVIAALVLGLVALGLGARRALPLAAGGLVFAPLAIAYWPKGYVDEAVVFPDRPFGLDYVVPNWTDSHLYTPATILVLAPLLLVGLAVVSRWSAQVAAACVGGTAAFYSVYALTWDHPRFLDSALPALFVLEAAGAVAVVSAARAAARGASGRSGGSRPSARASGGSGSGGR
jgi:hypothetical protein